MRARYSKIMQNIRNFMLSKNSREFLIFLFFVFVSFCFWLLQVLNDNYETEFSIPVRLKNVPDNVVMISDLPSDIRIGVGDRGTVLVNYMWGQTFYPVTVDFTEYAYKGNHVQIPASLLTRKITSQLNQSTKILSIKPDTLEFIYTQGKGKKIPVKLQGSVKADRQFYISDTIYSPDSIMVYAPKNVLDTISVAYTETVDIEHLSDTMRRRVDLKPVKGARFMPSYNDVTFWVDVYAEKTVEVSVVGSNFPSGKILRTFPSKVQVTFQVGLSHFKEVTADDFVVEVDYNELLENHSEKCKPVLKIVSSYVNHARISPQEIDYIIEQQ